MKLEIDPPALEYLRERGARDVTVDIRELPTPCCLGRLPDLEIALNAPADPGGYRNFTRHDIAVHLSRNLRTGETVRLIISGFGPLKKLDLAGIHVVL